VSEHLLYFTYGLSLLHLEQLIQLYLGILPCSLHIIHRATSSLQGQPKRGFHYYQKFYKSQTKITLLNNRKHQDFLLTKKSQPQPYTTHTYRLEITSGTQLEA